MQTVAGIFQTRAQAEAAVRQIHAGGVSNDRIALLTPGMSEQRLEASVPTADSEQPGMGSAMGGTVGGAMGVAGGATLGAAAASLLVPGVGPVIAGGILGAALLGAGGTAAGVAAGQALEEGLESGLPHDELYLYEDALRQGRSAVIAFVEDDEAKHSAEKALVAAGAESLDNARENWWIGLRDAEEAEYHTTGRAFTADEPSYRKGFEAAVKSRSWWAKQKEDPALPAGDHDDAYRRGFERGLSHSKTLREKRNA